MLLLFILACGPAGPKTAADCLPTLGDHCSCDHKCMTQEEIDYAQREREGVCDLGCLDTGSWDCTMTDGECVVVEAP